jgi:hypothetical protein
VKPEFFFPCLISAIVLISYLMCCPCAICRCFKCTTSKIPKKVVGKLEIGAYAAPIDQAQGMDPTDAAEKPIDVCFKAEFYQNTGQSQSPLANGVKFPQSEVSWDRLSREISKSIKSGDSDEEAPNDKKSDQGPEKDEITGPEEIHIKIEEKK